MKGQAKMRRVPKITDPILALHYRRAALRDEKNGFPYTAAMEWRKAAELSAWITLLANHCWQEWERIMHLPRRLAEPIGFAPARVDAAIQQSSSGFLEPTSRRPVQPGAMLQPAA